MQTPSCIQMQFQAGVQLPQSCRHTACVLARHTHHEHQSTHDRCHAQTQPIQKGTLPLHAMPADHVIVIVLHSMLTYDALHHILSLHALVNIAFSRTCPSRIEPSPSTATPAHHLPHNPTPTCAQHQLWHDAFHHTAARLAPRIMLTASPTLRQSSIHASHPLTATRSTFCHSRASEFTPCDCGSPCKCPSHATGDLNVVSCHQSPSPQASCHVCGHRHRRFQKKESAAAVAPNTPNPASTPKRLAYINQFVPYSSLPHRRCSTTPEHPAPNRHLPCMPVLLRTTLPPTPTRPTNTAPLPATIAPPTQHQPHQQYPQSQRQSKRQG
jgi:hypothetical protein